MPRVVGPSIDERCSANERAAAAGSWNASADDEHDRRRTARRLPQLERRAGFERSSSLPRHSHSAERPASLRGDLPRERGTLATMALAQLQRA